MFQKSLILQVLLGLVLDIKNNRQRSQGTGGPLTISSVLSAGVLKWLKGCETNEVQLRNLSWQLVLQSNKTVRFPQLPVPQYFEFQAVAAAHARRNPAWSRRLGAWNL